MLTKNLAKEVQTKLNACQKWSPLMTRATSKCICGVQPQEKLLIHYFCALLFTCPEQCAIHRSLCGWSQTTWTLTALAPYLKSDLNILILTDLFVFRFIGFHSLKWKVSHIGTKKTGVSFDLLVKSIITSRIFFAGMLKLDLWRKLLRTNPSSLPTV